MRLRDVAGAAALLATLVPGSAHAQSSTNSRVLLDVIVEEGRNRTPLTASDLTVTDADGPLPIESVRLVDLSDPATPSSPAPQNAGDEAAVAAGANRLIGIYLDEYHLAPGAALEMARDMLSAFVRTALGPRDLLVVLKPLDALPSIRLSADRDAAARVITSVEGRRGDYTPRSSFEHDYIAGAPERVDEARAQIALSALNGLTTHLGQFAAGRKTLIVLSDGFTPRMRGRRGEALPGFDSVIRTAMRGRVAVYAFSPSVAADRGDATSPGSGFPEASLRRLADETGGVAYTGADALAAGLGRVASDSSRYYLVSIEPRPEQRDGRVHRVSLTVRRSGAQVRARAGFSVAAPIARARDAGLPPIAAARLVPRRTSPLIRPWYGVDGADGGRLRVHVVWEPAGRVPGERAPLVVPQRVRLEVTTLEGAPVYTGVSVAAGTERVSPDVGIGDSQQLTFETGPGPLLLQMEILDGAGRVLDRDVRDLPLRPFTTPFAFGTPAVYRARTVRELRAILEGTTIAPAAGRQFTRTEHLVVRVPLVGTREVDVSARLVSGFGSVMRELPVTRLDDGSAAQVDLRLAGLAPGSYAVQFSARGTSGTVVDRLAFTLTP